MVLSHSAPEPTNETLQTEVQAQLGISRIRLGVDLSHERGKQVLYMARSQTPSRACSRPDRIAPTKAW